MAALGSGCPNLRPAGLAPSPAPAIPRGRHLGRLIDQRVREARAGHLFPANMTSFPLPPTGPSVLTNQPCFHALGLQYVTTGAPFPACTVPPRPAPTTALSLPPACPPQVVLVRGNARTRQSLIGQRAVVRRAVGLGGWHWLVSCRLLLGRWRAAPALVSAAASDLILCIASPCCLQVLPSGEEVKLQRNALEVLERPSGNEPVSVHESCRHPTAEHLLHAIWCWGPAL